MNLKQGTLRDESLTRRNSFLQLAQPSMSRSPHNMGSEASLQESRRTDRPLFFNSENAPDAWSADGSVEIPFNANLPEVDLIQGHTHGKLRRLFKSRVANNERGLELAFVNRHDAPHMDRVANATYWMGTYLGINPHDVHVATLAARHHDVGYQIPQDADAAYLEKLGKEMHSSHAANGAELVVDALHDLRKSDTLVAHQLKDWTEGSFQVADNAIRLHSNSVGTDVNAPEVSLLPRLADKLDMVSRVRSSHLEAFRTAGFRTVNHIVQRVQQGCRHVLTQGAVSSDKRHWMPMDDLREHMEAVDKYYFHRTAPAAIEGQKLYLNVADLRMVAEYHAYPSVVTQALGADFTNEDHLKDFRSAYDRAMVNAAGVLKILREKVQGVGTEPNDPLLTVRLVYEDGRQSVLNYAAK